MATSAHHQLQGDTWLDWEIAWEGEVWQGSKNQDSQSIHKSPPLFDCLPVNSLLPSHIAPWTGLNANRFGCQIVTRHPGRVVSQWGQLSANTLLPLYQSPFKLSFIDQHGRLCDMCHPVKPVPRHALSLINGKPLEHLKYYPKRESCMPPVADR